MQEMFLNRFGFLGEIFLKCSVQNLQENQEAKKYIFSTTL